MFYVLKKDKKIDPHFDTDKGENYAGK